MFDDVVVDGEAVRSGWLEFLGRYFFNVFFTITFMNPASSSILALDRATKVLTKFHDSIDQGLLGFVVAEQHQSGLYHVHGLLQLQCFDEASTIAMCQALERVTLKAWGRCRFELIKDVGHVQGYVSKYLSKSVCEVDFRCVGKRWKEMRLLA
jgi:hypothetical protein